MNKTWQLALLAVSIFLGIAFPQLAAFCKPVLLPIIFLLFLCAVLQVSFTDAITTAVNEKSSWITLVWQLLLLPLLLFVFLRPILSEQLHSFAVVSMCAGSITATTALARLFNLNSSLALVACIGGAVLMPLPLYFFLMLLTGSEVSLDLKVYSIRIFVFIVVPIVLAVVIRKIVSLSTDEWLMRKMPTVALGLLMVFGLAVMDGVGELMLSDPKRLVSYMALAFGISIGVQLLTYFGLYFLGRRNATTAAMLCSYRNMGLVAAIAGPVLGEDFFIFLGVWQFPMYLLPWLLQKLYVTHER